MPQQKLKNLPLLLNMKLSEIYRGCKKGGTPSLRKAWFVRYTLDGKPVQVRGGINKYKTIKEREKAAQMVKNQIDQGLISRGDKPTERKPKLSLKQGLDWSLEQKKKMWKPGSSKEYTTPLKFFYEQTDKMKLTNSDIKLITRPVMMEILNNMIDARVAKKPDFNRAFNYKKYKENLGNLFDLLVDFEKIPFNPCRFKSPYKKPRPKAKRLLTPEEREIIRKYFDKVNPDFFNFLMVIFFTSIRPVEILRLRVGAVNLKEQKIFINSEIAKDNEDRYVDIPDIMMKYMRSMKLGKYPKHYFLFGHEYKPQERRLPMKRDVPTKYYNYHVISPETGLGIDVKMYNFKHSGMRDKAMAGVSKSAIRDQAGHATDAQSLVYIGTHIEQEMEGLKKNTKDF